MYRALRAPAVAFATVALVVSTLVVAAAGGAGALNPPFVQNIVTSDVPTAVICRANGGSLSANTEADQTLDYAVTAPDVVQPGETYNIKIRPGLSIYPASDTSSGISATIVAIYNQITRFQLAPGLKINNATVGPIDGNIAANPDAGYYVLPANVPASAWATPPVPFDPVTALPPSKLIAIPGTPPSVLYDSSNIVRYGVLGTGNESNGSLYAGGSALQPPTITLNVTVPVSTPTGTLFSTKLAGSLPAGSFTGSEPGNFPAPAAITVNQANLTSSDTIWTDPTYVNYVYTTAIGGLIKITAKATCAPGWENNTDLGAEPSYYLGPNAIPNGTSPSLSDTVVSAFQAPADGGVYVTGQPLNANYSCAGLAHYDGNPADCVGDLPEGAAIDTSTPGTYTFNVNVSDDSGSTTATSTYTVGADVPPVANAGADQNGHHTGDTVTLDASGTTDPNTGDTVSYSWSQLSGTPVTLSGATSANPTFTVPASPTFTYPNTFTFQLTATDGYGQSSTANVNVNVVATPPTVTAVTRTPSGTVFAGDTVTLGTTVTNPDGGALTYVWSQVTGHTTSLSSTTVANPTFVVPVGSSATAACTSGTGVIAANSANCPRFQVVATATQTGGGSSAATALAAYASSLPTTPVANAGASQSVASAGGTETLDGSASTQAQGHPLTYAWTQTAGPAVTLSSSTAQKPTFTAAPNGATATTYTFSLVVTDPQNPVTSGSNTHTSATVTTNVTLVPDHVVANAGANQTGKVAGNVITLDGSGSTDPNLAPLSYSWTQVSNGAPTVTLSSPTAQKPTFTAPPATLPAGYSAQFNLTVTNGLDGPTNTDTTVTPVSIAVGASTPSAAVTRTPSGTVFSGDTVTLGATITNPDGTNPADYTFVWSQVSGRTTTLSSTTAANPTYTVPSSGAAPTTAACTSGSGTTSPTSANCPRFQVIVTKVNTGKASSAASLAAYASSLPTRPVANAGTAQSVKVGSGTITLDGSASTQAQGHTIGYAWTQTAGPAVSLSSTTAQKPTFTAPNTAASYTFSLTVNDTQSPITGTGTNGNTSTASTVNVTVSNYAPPVASSGANQTVHTADPVTLDASGSSQADGHALTYLWSQTGGTPVTLSDPTAVQPTFTAPNAGSTLTFTVTVTDTQNPNPAVASTTSSAVTIQVNDYAAPTASPGPNQTVHTADPVTLDGSGSSQADGHALTYLWSQTGGTPVTLSDPTAVQPTFTAPNAGSTLTFTLTVTDPQNANPALSSTTSSAVTIQVNDYAAPVASAGPNQIAFVEQSVQLDASGSSQADGHPLSYLWTQTGGTTVTLSDATAQMPTFTAPTDPSLLSFTVLVTDPQNANPALASAEADTQVNIHFYAEPTANAGPNQSGINPNATVTLDGSQSVTNSPHPLSYLWTQTSGPAVTLSDATAVQPTFTAPTGPLTLTFQLVVSDSFTEGAPSSVTIDINGIAGLDFSANVIGSIKGEAAASTLRVNVVNDGVVSRTVTSSGLDVSITVNGVAVPSASYTVAAKSAVVAGHKQTNFSLKWNHGASLHGGDLIVVQVCQNFLGDVNPANNCGTLDYPLGPLQLYAWPKTFSVSVKTTMSSLPVWLTNISSFRVTPLRFGENVTVTVSVNGGPAQTVTTPTADTRFAIPPNLSHGASYKWAHALLHKGDSVTVTACAVIPGNVSAQPCSSSTVLAK